MRGAKCEMKRTPAREGRVSGTTFGERASERARERETKESRKGTCRGNHQLRLAGVAAHEPRIPPSSTQAPHIR